MMSGVNKIGSDDGLVEMLMGAGHEISRWAKNVDLREFRRMFGEAEPEFLNYLEWLWAGNDPFVNSMKNDGEKTSGKAVLRAVAPSGKSVNGQDR